MLLRQMELGSKDIPFVVVGILKTRGPTAIKAGNKAIILADGTIEGWVGGHCTEAEIVSGALSCLKDGESRSLSLTTCQGGVMDVYMEPYLPKRKLLIFGHVPIAVALSRLAHSLNFNVTVIDKTASKFKFPEANDILQSLEQLDLRSIPLALSYAVIATMGDHDQEYAEKLLRVGLRYVGVVAGKKRAGEILAYLRTTGVPEEEISRVRSPVGIYIRAVTAEEIALSVMAEITELSRSPGATQAIISESSKTQAGSAGAFETDPVCGMIVDSTSASFFSDYRGRRIYFCCESCEKSFERSPEKFLLQRSN